MTSPASVPNDPEPVKVFVTDIHGAQAEQAFDIDVETWGGGSQRPKITSQPWGPAYVGEQWTYKLLATDPDGNSEKPDLQLGVNTA